MGLIEKITKEGAGAHPILVKDSWEVLKINYSEVLNAKHSATLYVNKGYGFAVSLLSGSAILVTENNGGLSPALKTRMMYRGTSYYIPEGTAYTILMDKDCELFAVGSPDEHALKEVKRTLTQKEIDSIKINAGNQFKS